MSVPHDRKYTADHEWLQIEGDIATIGITTYAADALGDVVYLDLPSVGTNITAGDTCGEIESTKSVSELYAPINGEVVEINEAAIDDTSLVNLASFTDGWLLRIRVSGDADLLDAEAYEALTDGN